MRVSLWTLLLLHGWYDRKASKAIKKWLKYLHRDPVCIYDTKKNQFKVYKHP